MATINDQNPTLLDVTKRLDPDGKVAKIVEALTEENEILLDMAWMEGNLPTGHKTTIRSGLPPVTWRKLNYGVQPGKSRTVTVTDTCGMLEAYAEIDKALADLNGNTAQFRLSEDMAFIEAMNQEMASKVIYGDSETDPEQIMGLAPRFNTFSAENGENIIEGGGTGADNTSVWLIVWGDTKIHGIYPKGSKAGLSHEDKGQVTIENADGQGGRMEGYRSHYKWDCGLTVRDWRYVVRIANIDVSDLTKDASGSSADLIDLMVQALEQVKSLTGGRAAFYCNKTVRSFLRRQITNKSNVHLNMGEVAGKQVLMFDEVPVRRVDAILNTEARVV